MQGHLRSGHDPEDQPLPLARRQYVSVTVDRVLNTAPETLSPGHHIHQIGVESRDRRNCLSLQFDLNPSDAPVPPRRWQLRQALQMAKDMGVPCEILGRQWRDVLRLPIAFWQHDDIGKGLVRLRDGKSRPKTKFGSCVKFRRSARARAPSACPAQSAELWYDAGGVCQDARTYPPANCRDRGRNRKSCTGNALRKSSGCSGLRLALCKGLHSSKRACRPSKP